LRTVSKWFEDVNQIIMTSYLIIEYLQVNLWLYRMERKCFCSRTLDLIE
jgi:hypothetical protein